MGLGRARALRGRDERLLACRLLFLPRGREEPHAVHALDRLQQVHGAPDRPPAVARGLHEAEAPAQLRVLEGRRVADEAPGGDVESEEREPVLHAQERHEAPVPRERVARRAHGAAQPPQAPRVEADDDEASLGHHHAVDLAQDAVRLLGEFQHVRQQHEVDRLRGERQLVAFRVEVGAGGGRDAHAMRDPARAQEIRRGHAELQRVEAEDVRRHVVEVRLLLLEQVLPERRGEPVLQSVWSRKRRHGSSIVGMSQF